MRQCNILSENLESLNIIPMGLGECMWGLDMYIGG